LAVSSERNSELSYVDRMLGDRTGDNAVVLLPNE